MTPFWNWEVPFILWLQQGHPAWTSFFRFVTFLGNEEFILLIGPLVFWCINKAWGTGLLLVLLGSQSVNVWLKELFKRPRPFLMSNTILQLDDPGGYSLPSGHAQNSTVIWLYLAAQVRRLWFWIAAAALAAAITVSRFFLGVHYPSDGLIGVLVGLLLLAAYLALAPRAPQRLAQMERGLLVGAVAGVTLVLCVLHPTADFVAAMATLACGGIGLVLERARVKFDVSGPLGQRALRYLVGIVGVLALWGGLRVIFGAFTESGSLLYVILRGIRYGALGLWVAWGAPALFVRLKLASQTTA